MILTLVVHNCLVVHMASALSFLCVIYSQRGRRHAQSRQDGKEEGSHHPQEGVQEGGRARFGGHDQLCEEQEADGNAGQEGQGRA